MPTSLRNVAGTGQHIFHLEFFGRPRRGAAGYAGGGRERAGPVGPAQGMPQASWVATAVIAEVLTHDRLNGEHLGRWRPAVRGGWLESRPGLGLAYARGAGRTGANP